MNREFRCNAHGSGIEGDFRQALRSGGCLLVPPSLLSPLWTEDAKMIRRILPVEGMLLVGSLSWAGLG
jgi:hypothetical protein